MKRARRPQALASIALFALALTGTALAGGASKEDIPFKELGETFLKRHCPEAGSTMQCELGDVLEADYVRLRLGAFDLFYPASFLEEKSKAKDLGEIATSLLVLQKTWLVWLNPSTDDVDAVVSDLDALSAWIATWKPKDLAKVAEAEDKDLLEHLPEAETVREVFERVKAAMGSKAVLGFEPRASAVRIICCPTRRDFMEVVGYVGLLTDGLRDAFWVDGVDQWTQFWIDRTMVLSLEYASWDGFDPEFRKGRDMRKLEKTGLSEHVIQRSATALMNFFYGRPEPRHFEEALALNFAIEICGRCNTIDGEEGITTSGATTQPYERFVPGGNSSGGTLPAIPAAPFDMVVENHWRSGGGKDHFKGPLRKGQKAGAKRAGKDKSNPKRKDKLAHFELLDKNQQKHVVTAPFLGEHANDAPYPPASFLNDYREFFRSYKAAFSYWLRTRAAGEESAAKFAQVIRDLSTAGGEDRTLEQLIETVYGQPLSAVDGSEESLEWRFLEWVAKGK